MVTEISGQKIEKILVVLLAGLGDMIMASPAIKALRNRFPAAKIDFLVLSQNHELAINCPYINEVCVLDRKFNLRAISKNLKTLIRLRKIKFDTAINLYSIFSFIGAIKIFVLFFLINPKKTIGRNTDGKGFFYNYKILEILNDSIHQVKRMLEVVKMLGAKDSGIKLEVWASQEKHANLENFLKNNNIYQEDFIIGINPGAHRQSHRWPVENFAILISKLKDCQNAKIVLTGTKGEIGLAKRIKQLSMREVFISSGQFSLSDLVNFIKMCKLYITNDTGPMHIANALGIPLVAITGGGPEKSFPYIKTKTIVLKKDIACWPCFKFYCRRIDCLKAITPEEVKRSSDVLLKQS